jgi:hypothetical protein
MAASTGPAENNALPVQTVQLGDNFNLWLDVTNTAINKINKLKVYDFVDSSSIAGTLAAGGTLSVSLSDNVNKGLTFQQPVLFSSGVTFNGPVTFNAETVTLNANIVTIDDYNIVLGDTAAASDGNINAAGGGGILLNRGSGATAEWLWQYTQVHGITGVWRSNTHIGFSGATSGIYPHSGGSLRVHGSGVQIDGGSISDHGVLFNLTSTGVAGTTSGRTIEFSRYSPSGSTAFIQVLNGSTYGSQPFVNIPAGANRKVVTTASAHGFVFGQPLYLNSSTYTVAKADSATTSEVVGLVSRVIDNFNFEITFLGEIFGNFSSITEGGAALTPGSVYYLSPFTAGRITPTQPQTAAQVHKAVLIATSATSGIVYPFTGGVLSAPVSLPTANSVGTIFTQYNQFKIGDFVRWDGSPRGVTYSGTDGLTYANVYSNGAYVKAQANSASEAELAGMVIATTDAAATGTSGVNGTFTLLMDGFFSGLSLPASYGTPANGTVYFLAKDCVGSTPYSCLESNTPSIAVNYPTEAGTVRKPLLMSTSSSASNWSGYLFSYRGDVADVQGLSASIKLDDLLVQNLGSCGAAADLRFGVRIGTGIAGGQQVMRFPSARPGSVDIGYSGTATTGASLDVKGVIRGGRDTATQGGEIIVSRYPSESSNNGTYPETLNVFGSAYSSGNSVLSYGIRPVSGTAGYESTSGGGGGLGNVYRAALEVGVTGGGAYPGLALYTTAQTIASQGTAVPVNELFTVNSGSMTYTGGSTVLTSTSSNSAALKATSTSGSSGTTQAPVWVSNPKGTISMFIGDELTTSGYGENEYNGNIRFNGRGVGWGDVSYYPRDTGATGSFRFTKNSSTVGSVPNAIVGVGGLVAQTSGITSAGAIRITDSTTSTSTTTGALTVAGGVGIAGALYAVGVTSTAAIRVTDSTDSTSTITGAMTVVGGLGVGKALYAVGVTSSGAIRVTDSTTSTSTITGALTVAGGVGIAGSLYVGARATANVITTATGISFGVGSASMPAPTGNAPMYAARAWVTFDSSNNILGSGNVTSVTGSSPSITITFIAPMPNSNYAVSVTGSDTTNAQIGCVVSRSTNSCVVRFLGGGGSNANPGIGNVIVFG